MGVKLVSASAGSVEIVAPATASNYTATMPAGTGNVVVNGINSSIVSGTSKASTSGTSIDFTSIPSWVKRITVMFAGVSASASNLLIQIGSGSYTSSGYVSAGISANSGGNTAVTSTAGFYSSVTLSTGTNSGIILLTNITGNTWVGTATAGRSDGATLVSSGFIALGGVLDRLQVTTLTGTATFSAGSINILYE